MSDTLLAGPTVRQALVDAAAKLRSAGVETPRLDAELLLADAAGQSRSWLFAHDAGSLSEHAAELFDRHVRRRLGHEPVARIIGRREFWSLEFEISPAVLDPRPDSETLVEAVLAKVSDRSAELRIVDFGAGSGCLLLALLSEFENALGVGVDRDVAALEVARRNTARLACEDRAFFIAGDWGAALAGPFDIVVSNPPYLTSYEMASASPELCSDPRLALDGGDDGLDAFRVLVPDLPSCLAEGGLVFLEVGAGQARDVSEIVRVAGLEIEAIARDLAGRDRCIVARVGGNIAAVVKKGLD
tara:strand:- start:241 stop:1143 length:903 start_codon:yes stop_codon:yes gene_type:complete